MSKLSRFGEILMISGRFGLYYLWGRGTGAISRRRAALKPLVKAEPIPSKLELGRPPLVCRWLEDLGPTFVKLGQVISSRPDLASKELADQLRGLQDQVPGFGHREVRAQFRRELGQEPQHLFLDFDFNPVAAASIAQVHLAILPDGKKVAVKVQRPGVKSWIQRDLDLIPWLTRFLHPTVIGQTCDLDELIRVFTRQIQRETDFMAEALNMETFRELSKDFPGVVVPRVYWQYTSSQILTMDYVRGLQINDWVKTGAGDMGNYAQNLMHALWMPFFCGGLIYGDPHPGNVLLMPDGRIGLIDFGIVTRADAAFRYQVAKFLLALANRDVAGVMDFTLKLGIITRDFSKEELFEDLSELMDKACRLGMGSINMGHLIGGMVQVALRHGIKVPGRFMAVAKAVIAGEGLARRLDPQLDVLAVGRSLALEYVQSCLRPQLAQEKIYQKAADTMQTAAAIPGDVAKFIHRLAEGNFTTIFFHKGLEDLNQSIEIFSLRLSISVITGALLLGSGLVLQAGAGPQFRGLSIIGLGGFLLAIGMGFWMILGMTKKGQLKG